MIVLKVDARKSPEHFRGFNMVDVVEIRHWQHLSKEDLDYIISRIFRPMRAQIKLIPAETKLSKALR